MIKEMKLAALRLSAAGSVIANDITGPSPKPLFINDFHHLGTAKVHNFYMWPFVTLEPSTHTPEFYHQPIAVPNPPTDLSDY